MEGTVQIKDIVWLPDVVDKLSWKHSVSPQEVEEVFAGCPRYRFIERGRVQGEDV
jgi:hypothetical protein